MQVVAAVAAVVSAFHAGAELHKRVKERRSRRARDSAHQKWENDQLQASLVAGEQQINLRYQQDQKELGETVRIGDGLSHFPGSMSIQGLITTCRHCPTTSSAYYTHITG